MRLKTRNRPAAKKKKRPCARYGLAYRLLQALTMTESSENY